MGDKIAVLDCGYVELIESWGSDERIIEAARMSTNKGFQGWGSTSNEPCLDCDERCPLHYHLLADELCRCRSRCKTCKGTGFKYISGDEKLLAYLYSHKHSTPFEMAGMIIEVQAPIFVFREWHRHRTQSYNEMSARYTPLPDLNYRPTVERLLTVSNSNKQAQGLPRDKTLYPEFSDEYLVAEWLLHLDDGYREAESLYQEGLRRGLPKELARIILPVGRYSRMRASANLRNWLAFLTLRMAPNAQWEIQEYARAVGSLIKDLFPRTWQLFAEENKF